jgi:hypothetical protein
MASRMAAFWTARARFVQGALNGKGGRHSSTARNMVGRVTFFHHRNLLHFGMTIVGLPYSYRGQMTLDAKSPGAVRTERPPSPVARGSPALSNWAVRAARAHRRGRCQAVRAVVSVRTVSGVEARGGAGREYPPGIKQ